jgi:hypothetical protein
VTVGNVTVGETGVDGTLVTTLPLAASTQVTAERYGQTRTATVGGLYRNAGIVLGAVVLAVVGLAALAARLGVGGRDLLSLVASATVWAVRLAGEALVALAGFLDDALTELARVPGRVASWLRELAAGRASPADLWAALLAWVAARRERLPEGVGGGGSETTTATVPEVSEPQLSLREAWDRLLGHTSLPAWRAAAATPGEIATHAIEVDGLPRDPVERLRDVYREVEYGGRDPDERLEGATEALAAVTEAVEARAADAERDAPTDDGGVAA